MLQEAAGETQRETAEKRRNIAEQQAKASVLETELAQLDKERQVLAGMYKSSCTANPISLGIQNIGKLRFADQVASSMGVVFVRDVCVSC